MTQTKQPKPKFKPGDLVQYLHKKYRSKYGIGIIIGKKKQALFGQSYWVYWTKVGFDWEYENRLKEVSK